MFRTYFLICAFFIVPYQSAIIPDLQSPVGFRFSLGTRSAQFGEGIRDWLSGVKDKIFNRDSMSSNDALNLKLEPILKVLEVGDAIQRMILNIQSGNFFLDIANLKLNPRKDWGFRIGNWYVIRRHEVGDEAYSDKNIEDWSDWKEFLSSKPDSNSYKRDENDFYPTVILMPKVSSTNENNNAETIEETSAEVIKPPK